MLDRFYVKATPARSEQKYYHRQYFMQYHPSSAMTNEFPAPNYDKQSLWLCGFSPRTRCRGADLQECRRFISISLVQQLDQSISEAVFITGKLPIFTGWVQFNDSSYRSYSAMGAGKRNLRRRRALLLFHKIVGAEGSPKSIPQDGVGIGARSS